MTTNFIATVDDYYKIMNPLTADEFTTAENEVPAWDDVLAYLFKTAGQAVMVQLVRV